jgi:hypothetical protein
MANAATTRRFAGRARFLGLLAAVLALGGEIALGAVVIAPPTVPTAFSTVSATAIICHAGSPSDGPAKPLRRQSPDPGLLAVMQAVAQSATLLGAPAIFLAAPAVTALPLRRPPVAHAPPDLVRLAAEPRGPPPSA